MDKKVRYIGKDSYKFGQIHRKTKEDKNCYWIVNRRWQLKEDYVDIDKICDENIVIKINNSEEMSRVFSYFKIDDENKMEEYKVNHLYFDNFVISNKDFLSDREARLFEYMIMNFDEYLKTKRDTMSSH